MLGKLDKMVKEFVFVVLTKRRNQPESVAREAGGKIFTFGSYRLGVHGSGKCLIDQDGLHSISISSIPCSLTMVVPHSYLVIDVNRCRY